MSASTHLVAKSIFSFAVLFAGIVCSAGSNAQSAPRVPPRVSAQLAQGQPQRVVVQFDESDAVQRAATLRDLLGVRVDSAQIRSEKAALFRKTKESVWASAAGAGITRLRDYDQLPMAFVEIKTIGDLNRLLGASKVVRLYEDEIVRASSVLPNLALIGQPQVAAAGMVGSGTTVAVIDTGVDLTRSAFGNCTAPGNPFDCKVVYSYDFTASGSITSSHGTNVAGVVLEVAPDTRIADLRGLIDDTHGNSSDVLAAMNWAIGNIANYNIVALNLSLGDGVDYNAPCDASLYASAISSAKADGLFVAAAAGNDGFTDGIAAPACVPDAVSVGAVDDADSVASFSGSASFLTFLAPGVSIDAAGITDSGTSQATPHIAGAAAVLKAAYPTETVDETIQRMRLSGKMIRDPRNNVTTPRLNFFGASLPLPTAIVLAPRIQFPINAGSYGLASGDFNGDGLPDLLAASHDGASVAVLLSDGSSFQPKTTVSVPGQPTAIAVGDFNQDGKADFAVTDYGTHIHVFLGNGDGSFGSITSFSVGTSPFGIVAADLNDDGKLDLVTANLSSDNVSVLLGHGDGTFDAAVPFPANHAPIWIQVADLNHDGVPDIVVSNYSSSVSVLLGTNGALFATPVAYPAGAYPVGLSIADMDGDGIPDLVVANNSATTISFLKGIGDGTFNKQTQYGAGTAPWGIVTADLNCDGIPDIAISDGSASTITTLLGNRFGTFQPAKTTVVADNPLGIVAADFNGDGQMDLAIASRTQNMTSMLLNATCPRNLIFRNGFEG